MSSHLAYDDKCPWDNDTLHQLTQNYDALQSLVCHEYVKCIEN